MSRVKRQANNLVKRCGDEDRQLLACIETLIRDDPVIYLEDVQVKVREGRVRLTGKVETVSWKDRLEALVSELEGVRSLENDVRVEKKVRFSDRQLQALIQEKLADGAPYHSDIGVDFQEGTLTLSGRVDTLQQKMELGSIANSLPGIERVMNRVRIGYESPPDDQTLKNKVLLAISELGHSEVEDLKVRVVRGVVSLKGQVQHQTDKKPLLEKVAGVKGVKEIDDAITFDHEERRREGLLRQIEVALLEDRRLEGSSIRFQLAGGTLFLEGMVPARSHFLVIEEILGHFPEVHRVVNELHIRH
ncbi:MAG: BON domain-containing protein [Coprothermobacterota bacterium]|nr:BON domain-containing protein [Coprothermobacterota bacterium]